MAEAARFDEICCDSEADKCAAYIQKLSQEGGRSHVVGGTVALQNALSKKDHNVTSSLPNITQDLPPEADNNDQCCDRVGKDKVVHYLLPIRKLNLYVGNAEIKVDKRSICEQDNDAFDHSTTPSNVVVVSSKSGKLSILVSLT